MNKKTKKETQNAKQKITPEGGKNKQQNTTLIWKRTNYEKLHQQKITLEVEKYKRL